MFTRSGIIGGERVPEWVPKDGLIAYSFMETRGDEIIIRGPDGREKWTAGLVAGTKNVTSNGPFGPSAVFDGSTGYVVGSSLDIDDLLGAIGDLDLAVAGTGEHTNISVVLPNHAVDPIQFHFGSHIEGGSLEARQDAQYTNTIYNDAGRFRFGPHIGLQDGATPGWPYNVDFANTARKYVNGQWQLMGVSAREIEGGVELRAYLDGMFDRYMHYSDPSPTEPYTGQRIDIDKNPYNAIYGSGHINNSARTKGFSIGAALHGTSNPMTLIGGMTGELGAFFRYSRALTDAEHLLFQVNLAPRLPGAQRDQLLPLRLFTYEKIFGQIQNTPYSPSFLGFKSFGGSPVLDYSEKAANPAWFISAPGDTATVDTGHLRRIGDDPNPAITFFPTTGGLLLSQVARFTFSMMSNAASVGVRPMLKVGGVSYASAEVFDTSTDFNPDTTPWTTAESKELLISRDANKWHALTFDDDAGLTSVTYKNWIKQPGPLPATSSDWTHSSANGSAATIGDIPDSPAKGRRMTYTTSPSSPGGGMIIGLGSGPFTPATDTDIIDGVTYFAGVKVRAQWENRMILLVLWYTAAGVSLGQSNGKVTTVKRGTYTDLFVTVKAPTGARRAVLRAVFVSSSTIPTVGYTYDFKEAFLSTQPRYIDGDTANATWSGTANNSASTLTEDVTAGTLSLGSLVAEEIPDGPIEAIGFYSESGVGDTRVKNAVLWAS